MITTPKTISDLDLHHVTGGLGSGGAKGGTGLGNLWQGAKTTTSNAWEGTKNTASNAWEGAKNQLTKTKDAWSSFAKMPFEGFSRMISPR